jgi:hypothetical protein
LQFRENKMTQPNVKNSGFRKASNEQHVEDRASKEVKRDHTTKASQSDSVAEGTKRREVGPAEQARRKANAQRDGRTNLGNGKPSAIVIGD